MRRQSKSAKHSGWFDNIGTDLDSVTYWNPRSRNSFLGELWGWCHWIVSDARKCKTRFLLEILQTSIRLRHGEEWLESFTIQPTWLSAIGCMVGLFHRIILKSFRLIHHSLMARIDLGKRGIVICPVCITVWPSPLSLWPSSRAATNAILILPIW